MLPGATSGYSHFVRSNLLQNTTDYITYRDYYYITAHYKSKCNAMASYLSRLLPRRPLLTVLSCPVSLIVTVFLS